MEDPPEKKAVCDIGVTGGLGGDTPLWEAESSGELPEGVQGRQGSQWAKSRGA